MTTEEMQAETQQHPTQDQLVRLARMLKAVANPLRLKILAVLESGERAVGDIVEATGAKPAATSQQLGLMRDRGVLAARRDGPRVYYRVANRNVLHLIDCARQCCEGAQ